MNFKDGRVGLQRAMCTVIDSIFSDLWYCSVQLVCLLIVIHLQEDIIIIAVNVFRRWDSDNSMECCWQRRRVEDFKSLKAVRIVDQSLVYVNTP